jgi:hypothetical protein
VRVEKIDKMIHSLEVGSSEPCFVRRRSVWQINPPKTNLSQCLFGGKGSSWQRNSWRYVCSENCMGDQLRVNRGDLMLSSDEEN